VLQINPSADSYLGTVDGSDYIEGGGGSDVIFGNQARTDLIGGNSNLFTLSGTCNADTESAGLKGSCRRPDAPNMIFGGLRRQRHRAQRRPGNVGANGEAHDGRRDRRETTANVVRLVGINGTPASGFLLLRLRHRAFEHLGTERIVPRAVTLLDYTPGGNDLLGLTGPVVLREHRSGHRRCQRAGEGHRGPRRPGRRHDLRRRRQ